MSDDVERLELARRVKMAADSYAHDGMHPKYAAHIADELLKSGVTLPTPPRATPLEAATRNRVLMAGCDWGSMLEINRREWLQATASDIAAAVRALSDEAIMADSQFPTPEGTDWRPVASRIRAALLARLTEGGAA